MTRLPGFTQVVHYLGCAGEILVPGKMVDGNQGIDPRCQCRLQAIGGILDGQTLVSSEPQLVQGIFIYIRCRFLLRLLHYRPL